MKIAATYLLICLLLAIGIPAQSQVSNHYNINIYNGLPSNHVYSAITDNYGYLWMCTASGVVRYDGYELKTFSTGDGLSTNDVWGLFEDRKGRIWLRCYSSKVGYIYKNRYHDAYLQAQAQTLYPRHIADYDSGVVFLTRCYDSVLLKNECSSILCTEKNDTISIRQFCTSDGDITNSCEIVDFLGNQVKMSKIGHDGIPKDVTTCPYKAPFNRRSGPSVTQTAVLHYLFDYIAGRDTIFTFNLHNCVAARLNFCYAPGKPDSLVSVDFSKQFIYVVGVHSIYKLDSNLHTQQQFPVSNLINNNQFIGKSVTNFFDDAFWGRCITTETDGAYLSFDRNAYFRRVNVPGIADYTYLGKLGDSLALFWNNQLKTLMSINKDQKVSYQRITGLEKVRSVVRYNDTFSLLGNYNNIFLINNRTLRITNFPEVPHARTNFSIDGGFLRTRIENLKNIVADYENNIVYVCANGLRKTFITKDSAHIKTISGDLYSDITLDPFHHVAWAYNDNQILLCKADKTYTFINASYFRLFGINNIKKIFVDNRYGNLLIQDDSHLFICDIAKARLRRLFANYNLKNAKCYVENGKVVLAGTFGVLFCKIKGRNVFGNPVVYPNIKNSQYLQAESAIVLKDKMFLKTDNASYILDIPSDSILEKNERSFSPQYKIIVSYQDSIFDLKNNSQLAISQENGSLQLNTINPQGNGTVKYSYFISGIDNTWHDLNADELVLPKLEADKDYTLSIIARDNVWNSNESHIVLHVIPYWWQITKWRIVIITGIVIVIILLLAGVILLTRYFVEKGNRKKQFMTELELRSIYAQINPHFIFNTLNTALYFIRKKRLEDAYAHVSKFSRLLWAYLESSRNRFITLGDEIHNIRNYLELQQTRFDHAFTYEIVVTNIAVPHHVKIPSLLLQPIVENAVNHGLMPKEADGHLRIEFSRNAGTDDISCTIDDNGVGRKKEKQEDNETISEKRSYGGVLIKELISAFNKYEKMGIDIKYIDKELPQTGTTVIINIKNPQYANAEYEKI